MIPLVILAGGLVASTGIRLYKTLKKYDELTPDDIITSAENESTNLPTTELVQSEAEEKKSLERDLKVTAGTLAFSITTALFFPSLSVLRIRLKITSRY